MVSAVELEPVPAITGTRPFAVSMVISTTLMCSSWLRVADSPVVPQGTIQLVPAFMFHSIRALRASSSSFPSLKGVTMATMAPPICFFCPLLAFSPFLIALILLAIMLTLHYSIFVVEKKHQLFDIPIYRLLKVLCAEGKCC